jgi:hypothetical protein
MTVEGRKRSLIDFAYAREVDDEWTTLSITSREMLAVERAVKGFTAQQFFASVTVTGLYRVAYVVLRLRGVVDASTTFDQFTDSHDVKFGPAPSNTAEGSDTSEDDEEDEVGAAADPTLQTA